MLSQRDLNTNLDLVVGLLTWVYAFADERK